MFFQKKSKEAPVQVLACVDVDLSDVQQETLDDLEVDAQGMVKLGDVTRNVFGRQVQYISYYFDGVGGAVDATEGLRVFKDTVSYHEYKIHKDDVLVFIGRVMAHRGRI